jgi:hypothetical protein
MKSSLIDLSLSIVHSSPDDIAHFTTSEIIEREISKGTGRQAALRRSSLERRDEFVTDLSSFPKDV